MTAPTTGPWMVHEDGWVFSPSTDRVVFDIPSPIESGPSDEDWANLKMGAAAPELAKALEEGLRYIDEGGADPCPVCGVRPEKCGCWVGMARAALRKAGLLP